MSTNVASRSKGKSPYKNLNSSSNPKLASNLTRQVYLHDLPSKRQMRSVEPDDNRRYHSSSRNMTRDFKLDLSRRQNHSQEKSLFSDRKSLDKKASSRQQHSTRGSKFAKTKLFASSSRLDKHTDKSTTIGSLVAGEQQRQARLREDRRRHEQGKNCRVVVIEGQEETEIFI